MKVMELPTLDEIRGWPATVDVSRAAVALGISKSKLYELIKRGEAPVRVIDVGAKRVITASIVRLLEAA
ncbi:DNA-binding protein [Streptomyces sp. NPDC005244]|uniref:DNA-binding protein n=1 Tax=Streptomyces sp. NPDC005244 TaxID=3364708 RepID=UPI003685F682